MAKDKISFEQFSEAVDADYRAFVNDLQNLSRH